MYSGSTLTRYSGRVLGAHQKIDRIARRHLKGYLQDNTSFPSIQRILHYEGKNGPDGIKRKSPAKDEPWHYYSPANESDIRLTDQLQDHYDQLVSELRKGNIERAAFEAAWLAHAIVDGLTPAHHYPYEEKLTELRGGQGIETRTTIKAKLVLPGTNRRNKIKNNWKMWGPKGLLTTHGLFEIGVATLILPLGFSDAEPSETDIKKVKKLGVIGLFKQTARDIAELQLYERYYHSGWTPKLAYDVRHFLGPVIIKAVTLTWYNAIIDADLSKKEK